jgi:hypothetical protein
MNGNHPTDMLARAIPDELPPDRIDVERIIGDGDRARRRHRAALAGASLAGVAVLAAATAFAVVQNGAPPEEATPYPAAAFEFDPAMAGYPEEVPPGETGEGDRFAGDAGERFGPLLVEAGVWSDLPEDVGEDCGDGSCGSADAEFRVVGQQLPGNYGQVYLRSYAGALFLAQAAQTEPSPFTLDLMLPGGWTAEPGPDAIGVFPRHLISDKASYTDQDPLLASEELDDGRTLLTADHGCAYDAVVVYPNGTALRASWNTGCERLHYPLELAALTDALLAMPQYDLDTADLAPVEELLEVSPAWPYTEEWPEAAAADAAASTEAAALAVEERFSGAELAEGAAEQTVFTGELTAARRHYAAAGTLPVEGGPSAGLDFSLRYSLPGGWVAGCWTDRSTPGPYLVSPTLDDCAETEVDGRTVVTQTTVLEDGHAYAVTVFDPDGWAARIETSVPAGAELDLEALVDLVAALPAPVYDPDAVPAD